MRWRLLLLLRMLYSFSFFLLFHFFPPKFWAHFSSLKTSAIELNNTMYRMLSLRCRLFIGNLTQFGTPWLVNLLLKKKTQEEEEESNPRPKVTKAKSYCRFQIFQPNTTSVRDSEPPRRKRRDGKSTSVGQE